MDLKSGGLMKVFVLLGILAASYTEVVIEDSENTPFSDSDDDHGDVQIIEEYVRDVYVVSSDGDPEYVEFVQETISANLKSEGYIYIKVTGKEVQLIEGNEGLEGINLAGDGDGTAENMFEGIVNVLVLDGVRSNVIVLVKSNTTEENRGIDSLFALISTKKSRIDFLTMEGDEQGGRNKRAASGGISVYQQIAQASGGMVIQTTKNNIGSVVNLLKQTLKTNPVDIMRFQFIRPAGQAFKVPVDDTMTQLTLQIQTLSGIPVTIIAMPSGLPAPLKGAITPLGSKLEIIEFNITKTSDIGQWKFTKLTPGDWDVTVRGQSPVDFTYAFMEPGPGGIGSYPIKGRPISGKTYQLSVKVPQIDKIKSVFVAMLLDNHNTPMGMATLKNIGGRRGKTMFTANVTIPKFDFKVAVDGLDKTSHQIRRLDPILISPISIRLLVQTGSGTKLYVNETLAIPFTVTNEAGKQQDVLIKIEDDKNFAQSPVFLFYTLKAGENVTKHFTIKGGLVAGVTTTVTITAKPYVRNQQTKGQFEIRRFTVEERQKKKNDTINPTCNVTSVIGKCIIGADLCECVNHTWSMEVLVGDEGFGLQDIFPSGAGSNNSFHHDSYTKGQTIDKGPIKASIGADCCHQMASIQVVDKAGNLAQCTPNITQNFTAPDPKVCNHTHINQTIGCKTMTPISQCKPSLTQCDCLNTTWRLRVEFNRTNSIDLHQAFTLRAGNNASLTRTGQVVEVGLDCCQQDITIVGQDLAGNIGECNYTGSKIPDCTTTTPTTTSTTTTATTTVTTTQTSTSTTATTATTLAGSTLSSKTPAPSSSTGSTSSKTKATVAPGATTQPPGTATQAPGSSTQAPGSVTQASGASTQAAGSTTQAPGSTTQAPGAATTALGAATQAPGAATQAPGSGTQAPGAATKAPGAATQAPGAATKAPGAATQAPGSATQAPGAATKAPGAATQAPGSATQAPGAATHAPGSATQAPGSATQAPGAATQAPGSVTQAPGAQGKPTTTTATTGSKASQKAVDSNKSTGVPESAVAAGMTVGAIGALSAVAVMAVLFKRAAGKASKSVDPNGGNKRDYDDRRGSAWS